MSDHSLNPYITNLGQPFELPIYETSAMIKDAYEFKIACLTIEVEPPEKREDVTVTG